MNGFTERLSRWDLVDALAHQDGGAHVDRRGLDERYKSLSTVGYGFFTMQVEFVEGEEFKFPEVLPREALMPAAGNAAASSVRQIVYELLVTLDRHGLPGSLRVEPAS